MRTVTLFILASWWLWPGSSASPPEEAIRQGLSAYARGDFATAEAAFHQAAEQTTDPGLVAFNQAVVAFHRGHFRVAEQGFTCCLADAIIPPERRVLAQYNRGVCWLKLGNNAANYRSAIDDFTAVLASPVAPAELLADARHNLEVAKLFWAQAQSNQPRPDRGDTAGDDGENAPERDQNRDDRQPVASDQAGPGSQSPDATPQPSESLPPDSQSPRNTWPLQPGAGTRPVLDDRSEVTPLSPTQTREYLEQIADRLARDRIAQSRVITGPEQPHVLDW